MQSRVSTSRRSCLNCLIHLLVKKSFSQSNFRSFNFHQIILWHVEFLFSHLFISHGHHYRSWIRFLVVRTILVGAHVSYCSTSATFQLMKIERKMTFEKMSCNLRFLLIPSRFSCSMVVTVLRVLFSQKLSPVIKVRVIFASAFWLRMWSLFSNLLSFSFLSRCFIESYLR